MPSLDILNVSQLERRALEASRALAEAITAFNLAHPDPDAPQALTVEEMTQRLTPSVVNFLAKRFVVTPDSPLPKEPSA